MSPLKHCCSRYGDDGDDCYRYGEDDYDYEDDFNPVQDEEANYLFASHFASQEQNSEGRGGGGLISSLCSGGDVAKGGNISIDGSEGSLGDRKPVGKRRRRRLLPRRMQRSSNLLLVGGPAELMTASRWLGAIHNGHASALGGGRSSQKADILREVEWI